MVALLMPTVLRIAGLHIGAPRANFLTGVALRPLPGTLTHDYAARTRNAMGNTTAAFPFSNKANWRLDHEDTCFDIRGALERDDCLIRAKPYKLWAKRTFVRGQLRQTGERHLSSASEEWLRHLCLPAIRAPLSTSPSPASSILVVSCHGLRNESWATDRWHRAGTLPKTSYRGTNVGVGFGARFLAFALLAGISFFIPFFLRAGRRALPSWISLPTSISRIGLTKIMQHGITP